MATLACPFCYRRSEAKGMWFRCTGRGTPGRPGCKPQVDDVRKEALGVDELVLPSFAPQGRSLRPPVSAPCPGCLSVSAVKVCPHCHTKLPAGFGESSSPLIAIIGAKGTGKSVYLKVLSYQLRKDLRRQFGADVRLVGDSQFASEDPSFLDPGGDLFPDRNLYAQTGRTQSGRREPIVFAWRQERRRPLMSRFDTTYLSFYDTAGEELNTATDVENIEYLAAADAIIVLLDPFSIPHARNQIDLPPAAIRFQGSAVDVLGRVSDSLRDAHKLGGRKNIQVPIAVAFAKFDAFFGLLGQEHPLVQWPRPQAFYDEAAGQITHEYVKGLLHEWRADDIDSHLTNNYRTFRYFAVSALGGEPDYDADQLGKYEVRPFRVEEPLLWLLSRFGVVPAGASA